MTQIKTSVRQSVSVGASESTIAHGVSEGGARVAVAKLWLMSNCFRNDEIIGFINVVKSLFITS